MNYVLFIFYLVLFCWWLTKSRFIINAGLPSKVIVALFLLKAFTGCVIASGLLGKNILMDTRYYQRMAVEDYHLLFTNPKEYATNLFHSGYDTGYAGLLSTTNSFWNDLKTNLIIKILSAYNILSFGNYYTDVIIYNFFNFFGVIGLFRVFKNSYPDKKYLLVITCFLLPSLLFYTSIIHKEGLIYAAIGIAVFNIYRALHNGGFTVLRVTYILLALIFMFLQRNYVCIAFVPAAFAWVLSSTKKYPPIATFAATYLVGMFLVFGAAILSPQLNFLKVITEKQYDFEQLSIATTHIPLNVLKPDFKSFAENAPQALQHTLLRPHVGDVKLSLSLLPLIIELSIYQILFLLYIFYRNKNNGSDPFIVFGVFFCISIYLIIGYTIPIIGAFVRYRSIFLPFLLTPVICAINWDKIMPRFLIKK